MKHILYKSELRGHQNHGWLNARHTFSFANYYNPERMRFGALRVLNDDIIAGGKGFGTHPHDNMEIITIPLKGDLEHKDNMGNSSIIKEGDIQVMSAGKGVYHSEFNPNPDKEVNLFQIWIFPNLRNVEPRYDQLAIRNLAKTNEFYQILSPYPNDEGVWIYRQAWMHIGEFDEGVSTSYRLKSKDSGAFIMGIEGEFKVNDFTLQNRDAIGVWETNSFNFKSASKSKVLIIEVPK